MRENENHKRLCLKRYIHSIMYAVQIETLITECVEVALSCRDY